MHGEECLQLDDLASELPRKRCPVVLAAARTLPAVAAICRTYSPMYS
jgi:hypothetical protein